MPLEARGSGWMIFGMSCLLDWASQQTRSRQHSPSCQLMDCGIVGLWDLASYDTVGNLKMRSKGLIEY